jgi:hypothetical protein
MNGGDERMACERSRRGRTNGRATGATAGERQARAMMDVELVNDGP